MTTTAPSPRRSASNRSRGVLLITAAIGFVALYLANDLIAPSLASSSLPLPDAPAEAAKAWFTQNRLAITMTGVLQAGSVGCLTLFVSGIRRTRAGSGDAARWGYAAVVAMLVSSALAWTLATVAPTASVDTVGMLRTANFIAGGTAHVTLLGVFVWRASRTPGMSKGLRVLAWIAVVPAVLSLLSLAVFEAAALILLGRLLCMVWTIWAAVSLARRPHTGM